MGLIWESIDDSKDKQAVRIDAHDTRVKTIIAKTSNTVSADKVVSFADFKARKGPTERKTPVSDSFDGVTALAA